MDDKGEGEARTARHTAGSVRSVERAIDILRILSFSSALQGMRFLDLQVQTGLSKATLHRLLATLMAQGLVERAAGSNLYYLGLEFLGLGERAANRLDVRAVVRPYLVKISRQTGDTTHLAIRSGLDVVYIDRAEGAFPVQALTANIGTRRPLGIGSASLALLAAMPDQEVKDVLRRNRHRLKAYQNFTPDVLAKLVDDTRRSGFSFNEGMILKGMYGIGMPVLTGDKRAVAAIGVSANANRMEPEHKQEIISLLSRATREISSALGSRL